MTKFPMIAIAALAASSLTLAAPVQAQDSAAPGEPGRYTMSQTPDGFLRLDTRTGAVALCTTSGGVAACRGAPEDRSALETEIARLTKENADLKAKIAARGPAARSFDLPKDEDMDKALTLAEKFMRRMMRIMREEEPKDKI
jgi:hypothetical protein